MPATPTIIGALLGLGTQMYSNALRKLPYMRHPWEHVLGMGLGVVFVNQLVKFDEKVKEDLDKMLERQGSQRAATLMMMNSCPNLFASKLYFCNFVVSQYTWSGLRTPITLVVVSASTFFRCGLVIKCCFTTYPMVYFCKRRQAWPLNLIAYLL